MQESVRIGWGSAYAEDDLEPARALAKEGHLDFLCFDALAERTLALAQIRKLADPDQGYDLRLEEFSDIFLPYANQGLRLITNMGAANPAMAAKILAQKARQQGYSQIRVAAVLGDDVLSLVKESNPPLEETGKSIHDSAGTLVSAHAYIGAEPLVKALQAGATLVIGGRIADPSLALAVLMAHFSWAPDDWPRLGQGILVGHLLECGTQVTGGNFADPPYRVVPDLDNLGMPIADVTTDGTMRLSKLPTTGGLLSPETVKTQLLYEIHDPARYFTPDVTADFSQVQVAKSGDESIWIRGATGTPRPSQLKVLVGIDEGFAVEADVSFAGPGALSRASLSRDVIRKRLTRLLGRETSVRYDLIGVNSIHGAASEPPEVDPYEVRLRVATRVSQKSMAERVAHEVEWQYFGPAGAGGMRSRVTPALALYTTYLDRRLVVTRTILL